MEGAGRRAVTFKCIAAGLLLVEKKGVVTSK